MRSIRTIIASMRKPISPAMIMYAMTLDVSILDCASTIQYPNPALVAMNSAHITDIHPSPIASLNPVITPGREPGRTMSFKILKVFEPMERAAW